jgi:Icc-related predicted phosphoesterase
MTTSISQLYEKQQIKTFIRLIDTCIQEKIEVLFVVGNLFGKVKPKNATIKIIIEEFKRLEQEHIKIFILPGQHDIPLFFENDNPVHFILERKESIHILYKHKVLTQKDKIIIDPIWAGEINGIPLQLFTSPNPLILPNKLVFKFKESMKHINGFLIPNLNVYIKKDKQAVAEFLENLDQSNIDLLIVGGNIPKEITLEDYKFHTINAPQINPNNFDFTESNHCGLNINTLEHPFDNLNEGIIIPISELKLVQLNFDVEQVAINRLYKIIKEEIMDKANKTTLMQLKLSGSILKNEYHKIEQYKIHNLGRRNFYFELDDEIEFISNNIENYQEDVGKIRVLKEIERIVVEKQEELKINYNSSTENDSGEKDNPNVLNRKLKIYDRALKLIERDYANQ